MAELYLEWGQDLVLTSTGNLQLASGWDEVRQRIIRRMLTNPQEKLPDGSPVAADYIFDTGYGEGLPKLVNQNPTQNFFGALRQKVNAAVMVDASVSDALPPSVALYRLQINEYLLLISVTLSNGQQGQISMTLQQ